MQLQMREMQAVRYLLGISHGDLPQHSDFDARSLFPWTSHEHVSFLRNAAAQPRV